MTVALVVTPTDLEARNLLKTPSAALAPAGLYHLIFEKGWGPLSDDDAFAWMTTPSFYPVGQFSRQGDALGVTIKVRPSPPAKTIDAAFAAFARGDAPGFGQADLALRFVVKGTRPEELADIVLASSQTVEIDDGVGARLERGLEELPGLLGGAGKWIIIALALIILIVVLVKFVKGRS